ncbi:MAG: phage tail protein [Myxococcales bacterium]|nr:phage tail protein [Myxococcales bacterium]MCB9732845.1 phage tail protein [Deltaproteobacteria bacterium]
MDYTSIGKKLGVIRSAYKPIKLAPSPYNPPPPGALAAWSRTTAQNTPGKPGKLTPRKVTTMKLVVAGIAGAVGVIGLFAIRIVTTKNLQISHHDAHSPGQPAKGALSGRRKHDPFTDFDFQLVIDGVNCGTFQKFDGLAWDCDVIEYKDSLDPFPRKRPGLHRFGNIKLTKGMVDNKALWGWIQQIGAGNILRKNGAINVLDNNKDTGKPVLTYEFFQAWPTKWSALRADGKGAATILEELELAVDNFNLKK